ncbi:MAG: hypothetical protein BWY29_00275 [Microgenomates group bacterium ADurb.Bin238]|nr:MAG: hypothetical protein BWY29_00275 [Microgenomates group bacterium ADurb.Bin238]
MNNLDQIKNWQKEIEAITSDFEDLMYSKYQIEELEKIIRANESVKNTVSSFWEHYKLNYTYFAISKIFHQIDEHPDSSSLINLLKDLLRNYKVITEGWWIGDGMALYTQTFREEFGKTGILDPELVRRNINSIEDVTKDIRKFRHKRIAHKSRNETFEYNIASTKINEAIAAIEELIIKYQLLLTQSGYESLTPVPDDWTEAFTFAWINRFDG